MIAIVGGGPAGFFAAITARESNPRQPVILLERNREILRKVVVSGGSRCNVTNGCHDPRELARRYPRGGRELIGPFSRFGPLETTRWFEDRAVPLKTEPDGRVFPVSDSSASIVEALRQAAQQSGVQWRTHCGAQRIEKTPHGFNLELSDGSRLSADQVLLATGGGELNLATSLGHSVREPVPSLFTFKIQDSLLEGLAGVAAPQVKLTVKAPGLPRKGLSETGPLLITHWGVSGPAVLRLSAWAARDLAAVDFCFPLLVDWCPQLSRADLEKSLSGWAREHGRKQLAHGPDLNLPQRLWAALLGPAGIEREEKWAALGKKGRSRLVDQLKATSLDVQGKALNREEFVTCGGIRLAEVDFKSMASRLVSGLHFAGEILDIDGITGGFNFQACWTTGYLAGQAMADAAPAP